MRFRDNWRLHGWFVLILLWATVTLACNVPLKLAAPRPTPPARPPLTLIVTEQPLPATATLGALPSGDITPIATATPRTTPAATLDSSPTPTPTLTLTPTATASPTVAGLTLDFAIAWEIDPANPQFAFASVTLSASGGEPPYRYFRDGIPTGGAIFKYRWGSCQTNPGTFSVEDGDGQRAERQYLEQAPCANP